MLDFYKPQKSKDGTKFISSTKQQVTYNCNNRTVSDGMEVVYSQRMGKGEVIKTNPSVLSPVPIVPDSIDESALKKVCNK